MSSHKAAIGPCLPPGFVPVLADSNDCTSDDDTLPAGAARIAPVLSTSSFSNNPGSVEDASTPRVVHLIGPAMPPSLLESHEESDSITAIKIHADSSSECIRESDPLSGHQTKYAGPALPPDYEPPFIGASLPPGFSLQQSDNESDDDDGVIGPLPCDIVRPPSSVKDEFERRAKKMKDKLEGKSDKVKVVARESWMTELPSRELSSQLGMGARSFRANKAPEVSEEDRDAWTRKPGDADRPSHSQEGKGIKRSAESGLSYAEEIAADVRKAEEVKAYNKTARAESLMDMHAKKMKKKNEQEKDKVVERVPFDRERDLQTKKFDDAQRKSILKKAAKLDSRFSHGGKQYL